MSRDPLTLAVYRLAGAILTPLAPLVLAGRRLRGKEDERRGAERRGVAGQKRPRGTLVWLHGASVGEAVTVLPLAARLTQRGCRVLITSGTVTSAAVVGSRLPRGAIHHYVPLDLPRFVGRFLDHWRPDLAVFVESELWPTLIVEASRRRIPLVLANARMSERSFRRWSHLRRTIGALLRRFDLVLAQSEADAARYQGLDAPRVVAAGSLKFDVPPPPAERAALAGLEAIVAGRPLLVAASTHPGEDAIVAAAHRELARRFPKLLTIIAPRHPERGAAVAAEIAAGGLAVARRSLGERIELGTAIYVADTMGELGLLYRLGGIVFVGGTLVDKGGQNPIEPAKLGRAVLHGPFVGNFVEAYGALDQAGGAIPVADAASLAAAAGRLLAEPDERRRVAIAGSGAVAGLTGALDRTLAALEPYLVQIALERF